MSEPHVLLRREGHTALALPCAMVDHFARGEEGELLWEEETHAEWVVACQNGRRLRVASRPTLLELVDIRPLPHLVRRWAETQGVTGVAVLANELVLVLGEVV